MTNVMHKLFYMYLFLFIILYTFRAHRAHHKERQIVSIQRLLLLSVGLPVANAMWLIVLPLMFKLSPPVVSPRDPGS